MALTTAEETTLYNAIFAETDAGVIAARNIGDNITLIRWINSAGSQDVWHPDIEKLGLFRITPATQFSALSVGRQKLWELFLEIASQRVSLDMGIAAIRNKVVDIWAGDAALILLECKRKATHGEQYLGGGNRTTSTITFLKLNHPGQFSRMEMAHAIIRNTP